MSKKSSELILQALKDVYAEESSRYELLISKIEKLLAINTLIFAGVTISTFTIKYSEVLVLISQGGGLLVVIICCLNLRGKVVDRVSIQGLINYNRPDIKTRETIQALIKSYKTSAETISEMSENHYYWFNKSVFITIMISIVTFVAVLVEYLLR